MSVLSLVVQRRWVHYQDERQHSTLRVNVHAKVTSIRCKQLLVRV